jgi:4-hydroxy-2-oxoglutarate aldolase
MKLQGIFAPLSVPFGSDESVEHEKLKANIERYNRTPLAGYVLNGSTGESVLLRWDEVYAIWQTARKFAAPGKILVAGTGAESTQETIEHTNRAASLGYDFALVRSPNYYKPLMSIEVQAEHYLRVADAAKIPVLLYSVPQFTGYTIEAPLVTRVAGHPNIVGMKDSSGSVPRVAEVVAAAPSRFQLLVGSASTVEASLGKGAVGAVLALACPFPEHCCEIYDATRSGDQARAAALQQMLLAPSALLGPRYGIPGLKYVLDKVGYFGGPPRRPLLPLTEAAKKEIDAMLTGMTNVAISAD